MAATDVAVHRRIISPSTKTPSSGPSRAVMLQQENHSLKQRLARMQSDYDELQRDSKYHQAKVGELSEMILKKSGWGGKHDQEALIQKTNENAELKVTIQQLQANLKEYDRQLETLNREKQENVRLLLEMSDVVRTLQSVQIKYDTSSINDTSNPSYLEAQQTSIKKIKMKIEAIMADRSILVKRCKELETECSEQQQKIMALESQFHALNTNNLVSKGVLSLGELATQPTIHASTSYSISTKQSGNNLSPYLQHSPCRSSNAMEEEETSMNSTIDHTVLKLKQEHQEERERLLQENERACEQLDLLKKQLEACNEEMEDAVIKRDEYKEILRDIIVQYKDLHAEHEAATEELKKLKSEVDTLAKEEEKTNDESIRSARSMQPRLSDVLEAYSRAMDKISLLERRLSNAQEKVNAVSPPPVSGGRHYRDAVARCKKIEEERNHFQRLLDKAREETRKVKAEAQKERDEAKQVRRRLTLYLRNANKKGEAVAGTTSPSSIPRNKAQTLPRHVWTAKETFQSQMDRLERENEELTELCQELLKQVGG